MASLPLLPTKLLPVVGGWIGVVGGLLDRSRLTIVTDDVDDGLLACPLLSRTEWPEDVVVSEDAPKTRSSLP